MQSGETFVGLPSSFYIMGRSEGFPNVAFVCLASPKLFLPEYLKVHYLINIRIRYPGNESKK